MASSSAARAIAACSRFAFSSNKYFAVLASISAVRQSLTKEEDVEKEEEDEEMILGAAPSSSSYLRFLGNMRILVSVSSSIWYCTGQLLFVVEALARSLL
jgi:hypothetical protein